MQRWLLAPLLVVAVLLRFHALDAEPWFDEIATHLRDADRSLLEIATTYGSQNQHVLYSLLARGTMLLAGDSTEALRTPAAVFGVLGVAALFLFARAVVAPLEALLAAAVLALSYHHVWFSQNARGYTMLLFWTLLASWLLLRALESGRRATWLAYGVVLALGTWTHLTMLFVVAGQLVLAVRHATRAGARRGLAWGFGAALLLTALAYAPSLPALVEVSLREGLSPRVPAWKNAAWALDEVDRSVTRAFGGVALAVPLVLVSLAGALRLRRERPVVLELAAYPTLAAAAVVLASGHDLWPRFFFFALGFAVLLAVAGCMELGGVAARALPSLAGRERSVGAALVVLVLALEAATVPRAFGAKQRYREALALVSRERAPGDAVLVIGWARRPIVEYYGAAWRVVDSLAEIEEARRTARRTWVVHSFPVALAAMYADVDRELHARFELVARFTGTLSGGDVLVWRTDAKETRHARAGDASGRASTGRR